MKQIIKTLQKSVKNTVSLLLEGLFVFGVVFVGFSERSMAVQTASTYNSEILCRHWFGTTIANSNTVYGGKRVLKVQDCSGCTDYMMNKWTACSVGGREYCRICDHSDDGCSDYYANPCGSGCGHIERVACGRQHASSDYAYINGDVSRACKDEFYWGPVVYTKSDGTLVKNFATSPNDTVRVFCNDFGKSNISGSSSYDYSRGDSSVNWDTSGCKFNDVTCAYDAYDWNCASGTIEWKATQTAEGNPSIGFAVLFFQNAAKYKCTQCKCGYKMYGGQYAVTWGARETQNAGKCNSCLGGRDYNNNCQCKYGYIVPTGADACTRECTACKPNYTWDPSEVDGSSDTDRKCRCRSGFKTSGSAPNDTCGGDDGKQCKPNFRYVAADAAENDSGYAKCVCDEEYFTWLNKSDGNPENDKCILKTNEGGTRYMDRAGEFYLSNDYFNTEPPAGCSFDWPNGSYPYMYTGEQRPSDNCSLDNSAPCFMNNWWRNLDWSLPQQ